ncbi:MAG: hypothetical protein U5K30_05735 [Acidimicrobiales bacterium]|nr:hypothetical protein [Acidimicrobiales bacterium]
MAEDLDACVEGTARLIDVIVNIGAYDPDESSNFAGQVGEVCGQAQASNQALQDLIGEL